MKLFRPDPKPVDVDFCDRCGSICDERCRRAALRDRAFDRVLRFGGRI
jgi:hypothetical protein